MLKYEVQEKSVYVVKDDGKYCHVESDDDDYLNGMVEVDRIKDLLKNLWPRENQPVD